MLNQIMLQGTVANLKLEHDEKNPSCNHQCFELNFEDVLCQDSISVCDWTNAPVKDGDKVLVIGSLISNEKSIKDGYDAPKVWWVMLSSAEHGHSVIKLQEDSNE